MLTKEQIENEALKAGFELVSSQEYKNLSSPIKVKCSKGHEFITSVESIRKTNVCAKCSNAIVSLSEYPPQKKGHRVVSIDQATQVAGVAVFDDGKLVYASQRNFRGDMDIRYRDFANFLVIEVMKNWEADELVFEDVQYQNSPQTFKVLAGLLGICIMLSTANKVPHTEILNKVWQSTFNIKGTDRFQQKANTIAKVEELFNISVNDDIADAVLLGYHYVLKKGIKLF